MARTENPKIFDVGQWLFPVPSELSGLGERPDLAVEYKRKFPEVKFSKFSMADGNILIQDCTPLAEEVKNESINEKITRVLNNPESLVTFQLVDALSATQSLIQLLAKIDTERTLIIYPGNGALSVCNYLRYLGSNLVNDIAVPVKRIALGKGKYEIIVDSSKKIPKNVDEVLVIDDVVASGQTAREVARSFSRKFRKLPEMKLASWLMLESADFRPYFKEVFASWVITGNCVSRPPINSLSCLLDKTGRYDSVKRSYVSRYLGNPDIVKELEIIIQEEEK